MSSIHGGRAVSVLQLSGSQVMAKKKKKKITAVAVTGVCQTEGSKKDTAAI